LQVAVLLHKVAPRGSISNEPPRSLTMGLRLEAPTPRHWCTTQVEQQRALAYWVETVCDRFLDLEIDSPVRDRFHASLDQVDLGPMTANLFEADTQRVRRTSAKIARMHAPMFLLMQLRSGRVRFAQLGRDIELSPGECVFIDGTEPYDLQCPQPTRALTLRLPADWLRGWLARPERHTVRVFRQDGWSSALCAAVGSLDLSSCDLLTVPQETLAESIATLLKLAIGPETGAPVRQPMLFNRLMRTLQNRFHEADLSPRSVAAEHHISTRSVHYAFASAQTTFVERLMRLRLERAHLMLSDLHLFDLPVAEVAARCGFADPSHFARRFRRQFGRSPLQFRAAVLGARH
jgi:AraC family transcriptional regulator, positive regulator of tynA and feaB